MKVVRVVIVVITIVLSNCDRFTGTDARWQRLLPGAWQVKMVTKDGMEVEAKIIYRENGSFRWEGNWHRRQERQKMTVTGSWRVGDGFLYYQASSSTDPKRIAVGFNWADKLVEINTDHFIFFSIDEQKVMARRAKK